MDINTFQSKLLNAFESKKPLTYHEFFDAKNKLLKPHWDIDDKREDEKFRNITIKDVWEKIIPHLSTIMKCDKKYFAVSEDNRPEKKSYHIINTCYKTTMNDLINLFDKNKKFMEEWKFDRTIYRQGKNKFRCVYSTKKEGSTHALKPINYKDNYLAHVIQIVSDEANRFKCKADVSPNVKKHFNRKELNTNLKVNDEITKAIRDKYEIVGEYPRGNVIFYHVKADCPYIKRRHKSNNTKIEYYIDTDMVYLTCCDEECTKNKPRIDITCDIIQKECLIDEDTDDEDDYFDVEKFQEIELNDDEFKNVTNELNEISNQITALQEQRETLETQIDNLEDIDPDTLSKQEKKQNKLRIKKNKRELKKKDRELKTLEKIKKVEEDALDKFKELELIKKRISYFEKYHCKILAPSSYIEKRRNTINLYKHDPFKKKNLNLMKGKFIDNWFECPDIRTYDKIDFLPPPLKTAEHIYNSYTGIRIDKIKRYNKVDFSKITDHIKLMVGVDEKTGTGYNEKGYEYMLNYLSHMVKKIGELPRVALLFKGEEGTGKSIFWNLFGSKILGKEYILETAEMEKVVGRFNMLNQKFIIILDETTGKDSFTNSDKLKNIITQDTIAWEQKGIQGITITNCGRYIFLTNNDTPIKIGMTDRRFVVFEMSSEKRNNREYFKELVKAFNSDDVVMSFVNFLKNREIDDWDSINDRPITETYKEIQSVNVPIYARFLIYWTEKYKIDKICTGIDLYKKFRGFLKVNGHDEIKISNSSFGRYIKKYKGVSSRRLTKGIEYTLKHKEIYQNLLDKKYMKKPECIVEK